MLNLSPVTVRRYLQVEGEFQGNAQKANRSSALDKFLSIIVELLREGPSAADIFLNLQKMGYTGSSSTVRRYIRNLKKRNPSEKNKSPPLLLAQYISRYKAVNYLWRFPEILKESEKENLKKVLDGFPQIKPIYEIVQKFRTIIKDRKVEDLEPWIHEALELKEKEIQTFAMGIQADITAVRNALIYPYSNGVAEGNVNRLKMIKRLMYGRAKFDLLKKRVLYQM